MLYNDLWTGLVCIQDGYNEVNGKDWSNVGYCTGYLLCIFIDSFIA